MLETKQKNPCKIAMGRVDSKVHLWYEYITHYQLVWAKQTSAEINLMSDWMKEVKSILLFNYLGKYNFDVILFFATLISYSTTFQREIWYFLLHNIYMIDNKEERSPVTRDVFNRSLSDCRVDLCVATSNLLYTSNLLLLYTTL